MVDNSKVSVSEIKPAVAQKFNLQKPTPYKTTSNEINFKTVPTMQSKPSMYSNQPLPTLKARNEKSTNPENELVDVLSNLSMPQQTYNDWDTQEQLGFNYNPIDYAINNTKPIQNIKSNYGVGKLSETENQLWSKYRSSQSEEDLLKAQQASQATQQFMQGNDTGQGNWITKDFAQYVPQLFNQMGSGLKGAAGGALAGAGTAAVLGQLGPQIGLPEELITIPTAAAWGGKRWLYGRSRKIFL